MLDVEQMAFVHKLTSSPLILDQPSILYPIASALEILMDYMNEALQIVTYNPLIFVKYIRKFTKQKLKDWGEWRMPPFIELHGIKIQKRF